MVKAGRRMDEDGARYKTENDYTTPAKFGVERPKEKLVYDYPAVNQHCHILS